MPEPPAKIADGTESQGAPVPEPIAASTATPTATARLTQSARLAETLTAFITARTADAATDSLMQFAAKRWRAALLLAIEDGGAAGRRGHGSELSDDLAQWIVLSLTEPSLLQAACECGGLATSTPSGHGDVEDRLQRFLGMPRMPAAIAIAIDGKPSFLLAVGDPDGDDVKTAVADLERLAQGVASAFTRLRR